MAETFKYVSGLSDLSAALKELPNRISRNVLRGSVSAAASVIRVEAKTNAPEYHGEVSQGHPPPGTLKRSIYQKQIAELSNAQKQVFYVGVRRGKKYRNQGKKGNLSQDAFYWWWVEMGHWVNTTGARLKGGTNRRAFNKAQAIAAGHNKYVPAQPFLRPAFEAKKDAAIDAMKAYMMARIPKEVAKLKGGSA